MKLLLKRRLGFLIQILIYLFCVCSSTITKKHVSFNIFLSTFSNLTCWSVFFSRFPIDILIWFEYHNNLKRLLQKKENTLLLNYPISSILIQKETYHFLISDTQNIFPLNPTITWFFFFLQWPKVHGSKLQTDASSPLLTFSFSFPTWSATRASFSPLLRFSLCNGIQSTAHCFTAFRVCWTL